MLFSKKNLVFIILLLVNFCITAFAVPFNIAPNGSLPDTVVRNATTQASYFIQNNTLQQRNNNYVKYLPPNVTVADGGCKDDFNLAPFGQSGDTCILNLTISGPVDAKDPNPHHHLFVCFPGGESCAGPTASNQLNISVVNATLVGITVSPPFVNTASNSDVHYTATAIFSDGTTTDVTRSIQWQSSNPSVATIDSEGLATTTGVAGTTQISGTLDGVSSSPVILTVSTITLDSISISSQPVTSTISIGSTIQYTATGHYSDGSTSDITNSVNWSSTNIGVTTIETSPSPTPGLAQGVAGGSTTISATMGSVSSSVPLTVSSATLVSINISAPSSSVPINGSLPFTAIGTYSDNMTADLTNTVNWQISPNSGSATISNTGLLVGTGAGTVTVSADLATITSNLVDITVNSATLVSIEVSSAPAGGIPAGTTYQFTATGHYSDNSTTDLTSLVTWVSQNPAVLAINTSGQTGGLATGVMGGSTTISASYMSVTSSPPTSVTVTMPVLVSIGVSPQTTAVTVNNTVAYTATGFYSNNTSANITNQVSWSSASTAVATIAGTGVATGKAQGQTTIQASSGLLNSSPVMLAVLGANNFINTATGDTLLLYSLNGGINWAIPTISGLPSGSTPKFFHTECANSACYDVGASIVSGVSSPLITRNNANLATWSVSTIVSPPTEGQFTGISCAGGQCLAGGYNNSGIFIYRATTTGYISEYTYPQAGSKLNTIACGEASPTRVYHCAAGGVDSSGNALVFVTQGLAKNWVLFTDYTPFIGKILDSSCTGKSGNTYNTTCRLVGYSGNQSASANAPVIVQAPWGSSAPNPLPVTGAPARGQFVSVSCTGIGPCVAVGEGFSALNGPPFPILAAQPYLGNFAIKTIIGLPTNSYFTSVSCDDRICAAVGYNIGTNAPFIVGSTDSGNTWAIRTISNSAPANATLSSVFCTSGATLTTGHCVASGSDYTNAGNKPLMLYSIDSGLNWYPGNVPAGSNPDVLISTAGR